MPLPNITVADYMLEPSASRLLIVAEGFEYRCIHWLCTQPETNLFEDALIIKYEPARESKTDELNDEVIKRTARTPRYLRYDRFSPSQYEDDLINILNDSISMFLSKQVR